MIIVVLTVRTLTRKLTFRRLQIQFEKLNTDDYSKLNNQVKLTFSNYSDNKLKIYKVGRFSGDNSFLTEITFKKSLFSFQISMVK